MRIPMERSVTEKERIERNERIHVGNNITATIVMYIMNMIMMFSEDKLRLQRR